MQEIAQPSAPGGLSRRESEGRAHLALCSQSAVSVERGLCGGGSVITRRQFLKVSPGSVRHTFSWLFLPCALLRPLDRQE